ncbi:MAG TPA: enoyl-CoA hydratase-related protein [Acidimicrobiia bacterium]|nr:enoyl-CoA hydratase-related protein [Acidimicrobiia bacterium]
MLIDGVEPKHGTRVQLERISLAGGISQAAVVWLNRPEALNALDHASVLELAAALADADDDPRVAAILITGRGRAFSAGGDMKSYLELQRDPVAFPRFMDDLLETFGAIKFMRKPVVALVNGVTAAGGLELLLACDFAFAAESARLGDAHLNYGQMGGGGSLALLPRIIGPGRARELFFSGRLLSSAEALDWGLVNRVVPDEELMEAGLGFAASVAEKSPAAVANAKYAMNAGWSDGTGLPAALRLERARAALYCLTLPDSMEGLQAFAEKRAPRYPGR